jgi:hypothetical protein
MKEEYLTPRKHAADQSDGAGFTPRNPIAGRDIA